MAGMREDIWGITIVDGLWSEVSEIDWELGLCDLSLASARTSLSVVEVE